MIAKLVALVLPLGLDTFAVAAIGAGADRVAIADHTWDRVRLQWSDLGASARKQTQPASRRLDGEAELSMANLVMPCLLCSRAARLRVARSALGGSVHDGC